MESSHLDITPDPKVLLALTHTPLRPLDALCELIDNGIDSVGGTWGASRPATHPLIQIELPGPSDVGRGLGVIRVADNGSGLSRDGLANALRAGYSGKNKYDTLGLFGMGFNIASGKLGRRTRVVTARAEDDIALSATIDLPRLVENRTFEVPVEQVPKPERFTSGTIIEIDSWWPAGDPNAGFALQLAKVAKQNLRQSIGRRYATILDPEGEVYAQIVVNGEPVEGYEHCVWSEERFVERAGWGQIPARITIDKVLESQRRCVADGALFEPDGAECVECGGTASRTVEERVRGWVGIQRFDNNNKFGIDLIRNGRAIRIAEKEAFFSYLDELGESVKEYPTDQQSGRIVGELHLDHVPVDFQKQDFQRSSSEWQRAIGYLRGESLLPSKWVDGQQNRSSVSALFQGYRKVRNFGRADMYMGRYDEASKKAVRIGREIEAEFYEKFLAGAPGYYDDSRWWDLVENATMPPLMELDECNSCGYQNIPESERCASCGTILRGKDCLACGASLVASAVSCDECGASQVPEVEEPWRCAICGAVNAVADEQCLTCQSLRGTEDPLEEGILKRQSTAWADLSFEPHQFRMVDGSLSEPVAVKAYRASALKPRWDGDEVPVMVYRSAGALSVYIDPLHAAFTEFGERPEDVVCTETALYIFNVRPDLRGARGHNLANIVATIARELWSDRLVVRPEAIRDQIRGLAARIQDAVVDHPDASDFYTELDQFEQRDLADRLISAGILDELPGLRGSGRYLRYCGLGVLARLFSSRPEWWFSHVWAEHLPDRNLLGGYAESARARVTRLYARCLEDCAEYAGFDDPDRFLSMRAEASVGFLEAALR